MSSQNWLEPLKSWFGFDSFRPGQVRALEHLQAEQHVLVVMPTGAGKSLIYQMGAMLRPGTTLVFSPLIALMKDQVDALQSRGLPATYINSTLTRDDQGKRIEAMLQGSARLVYVAPERLRSRRFREALSQVTIGLLAVDEAHCISQWGHDFRPDYLHIGAARQSMGQPLTVALTATATPRVQADIVRQLQLNEAQQVITGFNRPNLALSVQYTPRREDKLRALQALLQDTNEAGIVYTGTRRDAEQVAEFAREVTGLRARHYHAGLSASERSIVQDAFIGGDLPLVAATNAFGMGIDRADLRFVIHYSLPGTLEAYYQEAGRAGRDGLPARCSLLYSPKDRALQEWFIDHDTPSLADLRLLHRVLGQHEDLSQIRTNFDALCISTELRPTTVRLGLSALESAGWLERLGNDGNSIWLRLGDLDDRTLQATFREVQKRQAFRRSQLDTIIAYAERDVCRRRMILDHFGDTGPSDAPVCCDVCQSQAEVFAPLQPAQSEDEQLALVILGAVAELRWSIGRTRLAQILKGSKAKAIRSVGYDRQASYGKLSDVKQAEIEDYIVELIRLRFLKTVGGDRPVVTLTPKGRQALTEKVAIPVRLHRSSPGAPRAAPRPATHHAASDDGLFVALRTWRLEQVRSQGIPAFCIFHDSTLHEIARLRPKTREDLLAVSGVGPAKLEAYGGTVLQIVRSTLKPSR